MKYLILTSVCLWASLGFGQKGYWQQEVAYKMAIDFDHETHRFDGVQELRYTNNSSDTLTEVYYHLYFNAFQPGSAMDIRSRTIADPDPRIGDRIASLRPDEVGYHQIEWIRQEGKALKFEAEGTLLTVDLARPIHPGESTTFLMNFKSQVPVQIRRCGRDNREGVDYTMTQWYPKMAEYDEDGWHTDPYVSREFHGVFGSFDVEIAIDEQYVVGGTGNFLSKPGAKGKKIWTSSVTNVHDFAWAADPNYVHTETAVNDSLKIHFYYLNDTNLSENWTKLVAKTVDMFKIMNAHFGRYPYATFSVIQGGDGGMEYPLCTMISGTGSFGGLVSVTVHEAIHNWYYGVLATNELKYPWMDEGFTTYAQNFVLDSLRKKGSYNPHGRSYRSYINYVNKQHEEPLTTHADLYHRNSAYGVASYSKGCIFLNQLRYIVGDQVFESAMKAYFNEWKFKHPTPRDVKRVFERESNLELDWYFEGWVGTTNQIDFRILEVTALNNKTRVLLERVGRLSMPLDILVINGDKKEWHYIPTQRMRGSRPIRDAEKEHTPWGSTYLYYELVLDAPIEDIKLISVDPREMMADVNRDDNTFPRAIDRTLIMQE
ncbi:MAG: M1 family metallopeptidase [Salibacteraceae bacterium]